MDILTAFEQVLGRPPHPGELHDPYRIAQMRKAGVAFGLNKTRRDESEVLLNFPHIAGETQTFFGGDQSWFGRKTQRLAGCGPTAAANLVACYAARHKETARALGVHFMASGCIAQEDYVQLMEAVYRVMGTLELPLLKQIVDGEQNPNTKLKSSLGQQAAGFVSGTLRYAKGCGLPLCVQVKPAAYLGYKEGLAFIRQCISKGMPVPMLTAFNRHPLAVYWQGYDKPPSPQNNGVRSHFVTITGVRSSPKYGKPQLIVSSWGRVCTIDYGALHKSWQSPKAFGAALFLFAQSPSMAVTQRQIRTAYGIFPRFALNTTVGILQKPFKKDGQGR